MSCVLFLESVAGIAGDMFASSFIDAGLVTAQELQALPEQLGLTGVHVKVSRVTKATMQATHIDVGWDHEEWKKVLTHPAGHSAREASDHRGDRFVAVQSAHPAVALHDASHWHTHYSALDRFLAASALDESTKNFARKVFRLIAEAEAAAHGMSVDDVSFHEVGAVDSIVDVVMAAYCVGKVGAVKVFATPVKLGRGVITIEHGTQPVPPPASARLCIGMPVGEIPPAITRANVELSTPTGLAILKALSPEWRDALPTGIVRAQGMGAGTMDLGAFPNVFRVQLVETSTARSVLPYESDRVVEITCNVDDQTAERTAWITEQLLKHGALDVWTTPIVGKKGRAAICLAVLVEENDWERHANWLLRESSTFGVRWRHWDRLKLSRRFEKRQMPNGLVTYKIGLTSTGEVLKEKPEFEDIRKIWDQS